MTKIKLIYAEKAPSAERESLYKQTGRIYDTEGISPSLTTEQDKNAHIMEFRQLTETRTEEAKEQRRKAQAEGKEHLVMEMKTGKDVSYTIDANYHKGTNTTEKSRRQLVMEQHTVAYSKSTREDWVEHRGKVNGEGNTVSCGDGGRNQSSGNFVATVEAKDVRIRKLTPVETERLQGYPDNYTQYGRKEDGTITNISNAQRFKMCGNGVSSPVAKAIIEHLIPKGEVKVLSTFTGIAGTELDLDERFKVIGHCEIDKFASDVLRYHYPDIPNYGDVTTLVDRDDIEDFDLLVGGFSCQPWSVSGLRQGFDDEKGRGQVIYSIFDILKKHKNKYVVLENVKGLLSHNKGQSFEAIMEYLSSLGYDVDFEVVNSKHFGLAQNRQRVFIVGVLNESRT